MQKSLSKLLMIPLNASDLDKYSSLLSTSSKHIAKISDEVSRAVSETSSGAISQAEDLSNIMFLLNNLDIAFRNIQNSVITLKDGATLTENLSIDGNNNLQNLNISVNNVTESFAYMSKNILNLNTDIKSIGKIADTIKNISTQTNLLAINATIEAAKAGEAGKGFAVVAGDIKRLADVSKKSTENISKLVKSIIIQTEDVVMSNSKVKENLVSQVDIILGTTSSFNGILNALINTSPKLKQTSDDTEKAVKEKDVVIEKMESISAVSQMTSAASEEVTASIEDVFLKIDDVAKTAENLKQISNDIVENLQIFKL